jgi:hypothetical protein
MPYFKQRKKKLFEHEDQELPGFVKGVFISDLFEEICTFY